MVIIRKAEEKDRGQLVMLWKELLDYHFHDKTYFELKNDSEETWLAHVMGDPDRKCVFVADKSNTLIGFIVCEISKRPPIVVNRDYGLISNLAVTEKYRNRFIGHKLYQRAIEWFKEKGFNRIEVRVFSKNIPAASFWKSAGFKTYICDMYLEI